MEKNRLIILEEDLKTVKDTFEKKKEVKKPDKSLITEFDRHVSVQKSYQEFLKKKIDKQTKRLKFIRNMKALDKCLDRFPLKGGMGIVKTMVSKIIKKLYR